ncbi:unnamed protein product [Gordionus sp. m RMFG-2023]|uniref:probable arginine--tRNA ligase, mitochondrial n=1 Tax=Gordionus sp. m RMFG-2023 TaxID=3053472 RepID=UPI0030DF7231
MKINFLKKYFPIKENNIKRFDILASPDKNINQLTKQLFYNINHNNGNIYQKSTNQKVLIEYSSPNIAKLLHAGHLRSTLIGNFLANGYDKLGYNLTRVNYLGDWGFQIALLILGLKAQKDLKNLKYISINDLSQAYVYINKCMESDNNIKNIAQNLICKMEIGNDDLNNFKNIITQISLEEYRNIYKKLGVKFDFYEFESQFYREASQIIDCLDKLGNIIHKDNAKVYRLKDGSEIVLQKSDGSSLYSTRDVAAALHRVTQYRPDKIIYIVESGQHLHFKSVFEILKEFPETGNCKFEHVKFGRITGMQSRKGNSILVKDIIQTGKELMLEKIQNTNTTRSEIDMDDIAETLSVSSIIVNVLKEKRCKNYRFDWDKALDFKGDSGNFLQYTHARLHNLETNLVKDKLITDHSKNCLTYKNVDFKMQDLYSTDIHDNGALITVCINRIAKDILAFQPSLELSIAQAEPHIYLDNLFRFCHSINHCYRHLPINKAPNEKALSARAYLFFTLRLVLNQNLQILGIKPLNKM